MRILLAPDSFKSSLSSIDICKIIRTELEKHISETEIISLPQSDGGEGSLEVIDYVQKYEKIKINVSGPLGNNINVSWLFDKKNKTAFIESAQSYGLTLVEADKRDCMNSSSFGTGEVIKHAVNYGVEKIIVFLGGSSGNDGGTGLATALGYIFYNKQGEKLEGKGKNLIHVNDIKDSAYIFKNRSIKFVTGCDVNNPFYGQNGAAWIYAKQKGASTEEIKILDAGLKNLAGIISKKYKTDLQKIPGSGAAGGLGGGTMVFLNAELRSGADLIAEITDLDKHIINTDLILTGEGLIDNQTLNNKLVKTICERAKKFNKPVWSVCGFFDGDKKLQSKLGIEKNFSLAKSREEINASIKNPEFFLKNTCKKIIPEILKISN